MFKRVIVGIDINHVGAAVDLVASTLAIAPGAQLTLVSVVAPPRALTTGGPSARDTKLRAEALGVLDLVRTGTAADGAELLAVGDVSAGRALQRIALEQEAELLVVGSAHRSALGGVLLGDESRAALSGAHCAVMVVPLGTRTTQAPKTIGVAFNRTAASVFALQQAVEYARELRATLRVVEAVQAGGVPKVQGVANLAVYEDTRRGIEQELRRIAADISVPIETEATIGDRTEVLGALAERVDLMICGSGQGGRLARVAFGSTADWLAHHVACPVLVVPAPVGRDAGGAAHAAAGVATA
jgi:nucleotide-binding universal stress UspA family protein